MFNADGTISSASPGLGTSPNPILQGYQFYLNGIGIAGQNGIPNGLVANHWAVFGPRLGFAYDLTGHGSTVVRGGMRNHVRAHSGQRHVQCWSEPAVQRLDYQQQCFTVESPAATV